MLSVVRDWAVNNIELIIIYVVVAGLLLAVNKLAEGKG